MISAAAEAPPVPSDDEPAAGTTGVWIGEGDREMLASFDDRFKNGRGRSAAIRDAMRLSLAVHEAMEAAGVDPDGFDSDRAFRAWVRQAIVDAAGDVPE